MKEEIINDKYILRDRGLCWELRVKGSEKLIGYFLTRRDAEKEIEEHERKNH